MGPFYPRFRGDQEAHPSLMSRNREDGPRDWPTIEDAPAERLGATNRAFFKEIEIKEPVPWL
jgi:hypothetical protein